MTATPMTWDDLVLVIVESIDDADVDQLIAIHKILFPEAKITKAIGKGHTVAKVEFPE